LRTPNHRVDCERWQQLELIAQDSARMLERML
jgi:hypothetical protein